MSDQQIPATEDQPVGDSTEPTTQEVTEQPPAPEQPVQEERKSASKEADTSPVEVAASPTEVTAAPPPEAAAAPPPETAAAPPPEADAAPPPEAAAVPPPEAAAAPPPEAAAAPPSEAAAAPPPEAAAAPPPEAAAAPPEEGTVQPKASISPAEAAPGAEPSQPKTDLEETPEGAAAEEYEVQEYNEEDEEEALGEENLTEDDEMMRALDREQNSLDALVKSSSMRIGYGQSMEPEDLGSLTEEIEQIDKYSKRAKEVLGEVIDIRRGSITGEIDKRTVRFMNTYKLDSDNPFNSEKVNKILISVMEETFRDLKYEPEKCCKEAKWASNAIKAKVKQLEFERYKIISMVTIGEKHNQDVLCTCRFLWDADRDNYSCYTLENPYIFAIALCFGLYYE